MLVASGRFSSHAKAIQMQFTGCLTVGFIDRLRCNLLCLLCKMRPYTLQAPRTSVQLIEISVSGFDEGDGMSRSAAQRGGGMQHRNHAHVGATECRLFSIALDGLLYHHLRTCNADIIKPTAYLATQQFSLHLYCKSYISSERVRC